jgi:hypothetical protein
LSKVQVTCYQRGHEFGIKYKNKVPNEKTKKLLFYLFCWVPPSAGLDHDQAPVGGHDSQFWCHDRRGLHTLDSLNREK